MITLLGRSQLEETLKENDNKNLFKSLLNRIYSCDLISDEDKKEIKNRSSKFEYLWVKFDIYNIANTILYENINLN